MILTEASAEQQPDQAAAQNSVAVSQGSNLTSDVTEM